MNDRARDPEAPGPARTVGVLGYAPIDDIHAEFEALLARADMTPEGQWPALLEQIDAHLRKHFEAEDRWMTETDFPPRDCHMQEHAAVLASSTEILARARQGDLAHASGFVAELGRWLPGHADYLDSALAAWLCKRQYGGRPVVFHKPVRAERN
ncbi:MAG: hemerythrin [Rubrivivax sp.]|nr:hemerythrin [Rubrivivax sp.]